MKALKAGKHFGVEKCFIQDAAGKTIANFVDEATFKLLTGVTVEEFNAKHGKAFEEAENSQLWHETAKILKRQRKGA